MCPPSDSPITLCLGGRFEKLRDSARASGRGRERVTRNLSKRFPRHKLHFSIHKITSFLRRTEGGAALFSHITSTEAIFFPLLCWAWNGWHTMECTRTKKARGRLSDAGRALALRWSSFRTIHMRRSLWLGEQIGQKQIKVMIRCMSVTTRRVRVPEKSEICAGVKRE